ncbi:hypothetical protein G7043_41215 [Lentzea sp. NEAU-D13]|uniref:Uncharacterized protein n=1 Tax=Lentzea alba TaxID=2714351 RepID=A0A7C9VV16_9PSEU|nr:hypothetical protein [Lentzea alba]NGY65334.1 hypothetical protein [Lentzea alba]
MTSYEGRATVVVEGEDYGCYAELSIRQAPRTSAAAFGANGDTVASLEAGWGGILRPDNEEALIWAIHDTKCELLLRIDRASSFTVDSQSHDQSGELSINGNYPPPFG